VLSSSQITRRLVTPPPPDTAENDPETFVKTPRSAQALHQERRALEAYQDLSQRTTKVLVKASKAINEANA
jgi:hypothetical protein